MASVERNPSLVQNDLTNVHAEYSVQRKFEVAHTTIKMPYGTYTDTFYEVKLFLMS